MGWGVLDETRLVHVKIAQAGLREIWEFTISLFFISYVFENFHDKNVKRQRKKKIKSVSDLLSFLLNLLLHNYQRGS